MFNYYLKPPNLSKPFKGNLGPPGLNLTAMVYKFTNLSRNHYLPHSMTPRSNYHAVITKHLTELSCVTVLNFFKLSGLKC